MRFSSSFNLDTARRNNAGIRLHIVLLLGIMTASVQGTTVDVQQGGGARVEALLAGRGELGAAGLGAVLGERQASTTNLQTFQGALGGIVASPITNSGDPQRRFEVDGNTFPDFQSAASRSCSDQHNACAQFANSNKDAGFKVGQCDSQQSACNAAASTATQTAFQTKVSSDAEFDYFCDL